MKFPLQQLFSKHGGKAGSHGKNPTFIGDFRLIGRDWKGSPELHEISIGKVLGKWNWNMTYGTRYKVTTHFVNHSAIMLPGPRESTANAVMRKIITIPGVKKN